MRSGRAGFLGRRSSSRPRHAIIFQDLISLVANLHADQLWNSFHAPEDIEIVLDQSLFNLQISYLDLYLIHWCVSQLIVAVLNVDG